MVDYLNVKDLYDPIEGDGARPEKMDEKLWGRLKNKTLGTIRQ